MSDIDKNVQDTDDGGAIVVLEEEMEVQANVKHFENLLDEVDKSDLEVIVSDLIDKIERDKEARSKRDDQYEEGLRRTGLGDDAPGGAQFTGANKVVHPLLVESCIDFSARVMKEIWPAGGPVKSKIIGTRDAKKLEKAQRKVDYMNWQVTEQIREMRGELDQLTTQLPLGGGQYMKFVWNGKLRRVECEFIPIDNVYLPFSATNFYTAERRTHVQYITEATYEKRVDSGMYKDVDIGSPGTLEFSKSSEANDKIEGREEDPYNDDGLRQVYEVFTRIDLGEGFGDGPYILSIDASSKKPLSLFRNWDPEDDSNREELRCMVEFSFIPWRGAYPIGLTHIIGGLTGSATGALRALLDSAHIQNIPTLLKLKGGASGQTLVVQPTEIAELEGGVMTDDIRKLVMPMPFNGPSQVLFQLLGFLVDAGKGVIQTSFEKLSDQNPNQPVGTTMALIEQGMVVFSSIHSRMHASMAECFSIIHRLNASFLTEEDIENQVGDLDISPQDFDGPVDVIPVSDPEIFSETQRFAQNQAILTRASQFPQLYDIRKTEERFLRALKVDPDEVLQPKPASDDMDPVSENVAASLGRPIYVLPSQEHIAHLLIHLSFLTSPIFGKNPVISRTFLYPMATHLRDHLLNYYLVEAHDTVDKAQQGEHIDEEASQQVPLIIQVQKEVESQLAQFSTQLQQIDQEAQQFKPQPQMPPDNSMQIAQLNMQMEGQMLTQRNQVEQAKLQLSEMKMQLDQKVKEMQIQTNLKEIEDKLFERLQERAEKVQSDTYKQQQETLRKQMEDESKERVNAADNATALEIARMGKIGSHIKDGTGIGENLNP